MTSFTHTNVQRKLRELESPVEEEHKIREYAGYREAKSVMVDLGKAINGGSADTLALGLLAGLYQQHRYLQNEMIQTLITVLGNLAQVAGTDARNEFGIGLCREIRELFKDKLFWKDEVKV